MFSSEATVRVQPIRVVNTLKLNRRLIHPADGTPYLGAILSADFVTFGHESTQVPRGLAHSAAFAITR
jgi:hypothetical protein